MTVIAGALLHLSQLIINNADITSEVRPCHEPPFLDDVRFLCSRLQQEPQMSEADCRQALERLVQQILEEATDRQYNHGKAVPAYFDASLHLCRKFRPEAFRVWFLSQPGFDTWNQILADQIEFIAREKYELIPARQ